MSDLNNICQKSMEIADKLADHMLNLLSGSDPIDAATLNAIRQFVKDFPPVAEPPAAKINAIQDKFKKALPFEQKAN